MEKDIHTTQTDAPARWADQTWYQNCVAVMVFVRWIIVVCMFLAGYYVYQRDVNAAQAVNVVDLKREQSELKKVVEQNKAERDRQLDEIKRTMLTRELYEAYHANDVQKIEAIQKMVEQLINRP